MVFNATFNNISAISGRSVLLMEESGVPVENHRSVASNWLLQVVIYVQTPDTYLHRLIDVELCI